MDRFHKTIRGIVILLLLVNFGALLPDFIMGPPDRAPQMGTFGFIVGLYLWPANWIICLIVGIVAGIRRRIYPDKAPSPLRDQILFLMAILCILPPILYFSWLF